MTNEEMEDIFDEACDAATDASEACFQQHGDHPYCGVAWVTVSNGRSKFARFLKATNKGRKGVYKGITVSSYHMNSPRMHTQSMIIKEAGTTAFAKVLTSYDIDAVASSRAD